MLKIVPGLLRAAAWSTAALLLLGGAAQAAFSDLQFGRYQVADTQWNVSNCQNTTTCDIYSKVPGTAYKIPFSDGEVDWGANSDRYIGFTPNAGANSASYPHEMTLFEADGTVVQSLGAGRVLTAGPTPMEMPISSSSAAMNSPASCSAARWAWTARRASPLQAR